MKVKCDKREITKPEQNERKKRGRGEDMVKEEVSENCKKSKTEKK